MFQSPAHQKVAVLATDSQTGAFKVVRPIDFLHGGPVLSKPEARSFNIFMPVP